MPAETIYIIDPVVFIRDEAAPVGFWGEILSAVTSAGSAIGSVASKLGSVISSPVVSKLIEGGISLGGAAYVASKAKKQQKTQLAAAQTQAQAEANAADRAQAEAVVQDAKNKKILLYGGAAALALLGVYLVVRSSRK